MKKLLILLLLAGPLVVTAQSKMIKTIAEVNGVFSYTTVDGLPRVLPSLMGSNTFTTPQTFANITLNSPNGVGTLLLGSTGSQISTSAFPPAGRLFYTGTEGHIFNAGNSFRVGIYPSGNPALVARAGAGQAIVGFRNAANAEVAGVDAAGGLYTTATLTVAGSTTLAGDVISPALSNSLAQKADLSQLTSATAALSAIIAQKANATDLTSYTIAQAGTNAALQNQLAQKVNAVDLNNFTVTQGNANITVQIQLATKAETSSVASATLALASGLATKINISDLASYTATQSTVDASQANQLNSLTINAAGLRTDVNVATAAIATLQTGKADLTALVSATASLNGAIAQKANTSDLNSLTAIQAGVDAGQNARINSVSATTTGLRTDLTSYSTAQASINMGKADIGSSNTFTAPQTFRNALTLNDGSFTGTLTLGPTGSRITTSNFETTGRIFYASNEAHIFNAGNSFRVGIYPSGNPALVARAGAGQNIMSFRNAANAEVAGVDANGRFTMPGLSVTGSVSSGWVSGTEDPTTANIPTGTSVMWKNTTTGTLRLYANDNGTLKYLTLMP